uniref:Uncharacterized protein n=1 Tax=Anguilla anguilla TaxID=7936 RepID=A0A0E9TW65_ANGAN
MYCNFNLTFNCCNIPRKAGASCARHSFSSAGILHL